MESIAKNRRTAAKNQKLNDAIQILVDFGLGQHAAFDPLVQNAARVLYEHYWPRFVRFFCYNSQQESTAQELANEAMLKLVRKAHTLQAVQALESWAWTIARRTLYDYSQQQSTLRENETTVDDDTWYSLMETLPLDADGDPLLSRCLERQFDLFAQSYPDHAACIEYMVLSSANTDELANILGRTAAATREFLSQSRKRLKTFLLRCLA